MSIPVLFARVLGAGAAVTFTAALKDSAGAGVTAPKGVDFASIQVEGGDARYTDDNQTPTATWGTKLADGSVLVYEDGIQRLKFYLPVGCNLNCTFYRSVAGPYTLAGEMPPAAERPSRWSQVKAAGRDLLSAILGAGR